MNPNTTPVFDLEQSSYKAFRDIYAERTKGIIAWVGSGLSQPANLPTWPGLRRYLEDAIESTFASMEPNEYKGKASLLEESRTVDSPWEAFGLLKRAMGSASFQSEIRRVLTPKPTCSIPDGYTRLWGLGIQGMLTLNLDGFAARALSQCRQGVHSEVMSGTNVGAGVQVLKSTSPFVVNLHGALMDSNTWVLTDKEIKKLLKQRNYNRFLTTIFASKTVLFVGMSANDISSGGFLGNLLRGGFDVGEHYWLTDQRDRETEAWCENHGIRVIRYNSGLFGHSKPLNAFFDDLISFMPQDEEVSPVAPVLPATKKNPLPPPEILANSPPEEVRKLLTHEAARLLEGSSTESYKAYEAFCEEYEYAIYKAWFVPKKLEGSVFFSYELQGILGDGAFGRVFRAQKNGQDYAIKLLRREVWDSSDMLKSFRRGVRSMSILSKEKVRGMIPYHEAYELPTCVVMDLVEGQNLEDAIKSNVLDDWVDRIWVSWEIAKIIHKSHSLAKRVLHRDLRPSNIMLRNKPRSSRGWEVVVLDFDLSWHKDATEKSIELTNASSALGYLAPEQLGLTNSSTRNAAVDSFGLGMTMSYIFTGEKPAPGVYNGQDWIENLRETLISCSNNEWRSLPLRVARVIERATQLEQSRRIDMGNIESELGRLYQAVGRSSHVSSAELWAE